MNEPVTAHCSPAMAAFMDESGALRRAGLLMVVEEPVLTFQKYGKAALREFATEVGTGGKTEDGSEKGN